MEEKKPPPKKKKKASKKKRDSEEGGALPMPIWGPSCVGSRGGLGLRVRVLGAGEEPEAKKAKDDEDDS